MSIFDTIANTVTHAAESVAHTASSAAHTVSNAATLKEFDLPEGKGRVRVFPAIYQIYLTASGVESLTNAHDFAAEVAGLMAAIVTLSGGSLTPVAGIVGAFLTVEWFAIRAAANSEGVTLRGSYFPPAGLVVPTPGRF